MIKILMIRVTNPKIMDIIKRKGDMKCRKYMHFWLTGWRKWSVWP